MLQHSNSSHPPTTPPSLPTDSSFCVPKQTVAGAFLSKHTLQALTPDLGFHCRASSEQDSGNTPSCRLEVWRTSPRACQGPCQETVFASIYLLMFHKNGTSFIDEETRVSGKFIDLFKNLTARKQQGGDSASQTEDSATMRDGLSRGLRCPSPRFSQLPNLTPSSTLFPST